MPNIVPVFSRGRRPELIETIEDWERLASTKGKWASGYSAKELGRLWLSGEGPAAVCAALEPALRGLVLTKAVAEAQISFDDYRGGVRNHDVLAYGVADCGEVVIGVEGKVNESLDDTLADKYEQARARARQGKNTNLDQRADDLLEAIVGKSISAEPSLGALRYQLFSAIAGTVAAAAPATAAAAVVIHLIRSPLRRDENSSETRAAINDFCDAVGVDASRLPAGPIHLKETLGKGPPGMPVWLAVVETNTAREADPRQR